jgi:hypothetical protein
MEHYYWLTIKKIGKKHASYEQYEYYKNIIRNRVCVEDVSAVFFSVYELDKEPRLHLHAVFTSPLAKAHILRLIVKKGWHVHVIDILDDAHLQNVVRYMEKDQGYENEQRIIANEIRRTYSFV